MNVGENICPLGGEEVYFDSIEEAQSFSDEKHKDEYKSED